MGKFKTLTADHADDRGFLISDICEISGKSDFSAFIRVDPR